MFNSYFIIELKINGIGKITKCKVKPKDVPANLLLRYYSDCTSFLYEQDVVTVSPSRILKEVNRKQKKIKHQYKKYQGALNLPMFQTSILMCLKE